jgi:hypothetical protein
MSIRHSVRTKRQLIQISTGNMLPSLLTIKIEVRFNGHSGRADMISPGCCSTSKLMVPT